MNTNEDLIRESIIRDISEGVMTIGFDGVIQYVNPAACDILCMAESDMAGKKFASCFFAYEENDGFNQAVLDAVYDKDNFHESFVEYYDGEKTRQLHMTTAFLKNGDERIGVIASFRDITELSELRDAVKAMEKIKALNEKLELRNKLLSETFGRFLSDDIVKELLDTPDGLAMGGKKREVTVMMSDLRGFTAMSERMDAKDLITMLNHYFEIMCDIIEKYNGTVIEFLGDGIFVVFGAPRYTPDHAANAVAAAIEMEAAMEGINIWNKEQGYPLLEMGIGINTGDTIVGNIGSIKRTKYGVMGSNVNLTGRIESYTTGGQIMISPSTRKKVNAPVTVSMSREVFPKGTDMPIEISQVTGIGEPYNVTYNEPVEELTNLQKPCKVEFVVVSGKHVDDEAHSGFITAISTMEAKIETKEELVLFENIQINAHGKLFAKVTRKEEESYIVRFTSKPVGFDEWYEGL